MTPDEIARATASQALVFDAVMRAITDIHPMPQEGEGAGGIDFYPTIDGLLQAMANMVVLSGAFTTTRDKREFADNVRRGLVKHIADFERDVRNGTAWQGFPIDRMP